MTRTQQPPTGPVAPPPAGSSFFLVLILGVYALVFAVTAAYTGDAATAFGFLAGVFCCVACPVFIICHGFAVRMGNGETVWAVLRSFAAASVVAASAYLLSTVFDLNGEGTRVGVAVLAFLGAWAIWNPLPDGLVG